ncbi:membrane magnesium transporter 1 domain protein, partial [Cooperia oncophora]
LPFLHYFIHKSRSFQHRSYLRLTEQPFVALPADVLAQTLISLVALIYGASHVAGAFQHIKSDPNRDRSWDEAGSCMSFVTFEHRGKAMSPAHAVVRQRTEEVAQVC